MQPLHIHRDGHIVRRVTNAAAPPVLLKEHREGLSHAALKIRAVQPFRDGGGARRAFLAHAHLYLRHRRGLRAGAHGIGEDVHGGEAALFEEGERFAELLLRLLGKARDEVGGDGGLVKILAQQRDRLVKTRGIVPAVHSLERRVAAGLHGKVEVRAEILELCRPLAKFSRHGARLERAETDAHLPALAGDQLQ